MPNNPPPTAPAPVPGPPKKLGYAKVMAYAAMPLGLCCPAINAVLLIIAFVFMHEVVSEAQAQFRAGMQQRGDNPAYIQEQTGFWKVVNGVPPIKEVKNLIIVAGIITIVVMCLGFGMMAWSKFNSPT